MRAAGAGAFAAASGARAPGEGYCAAAGSARQRRASGEQSAHGESPGAGRECGIMPLSTAQPPIATMNYKRLGRAGLKVSELSFGSWVTYGNQLDTKAAADCMAAAWDLGVNFFDNAEIYAAGESERIMGEVLKKLAWPRLKYVVSTKFFWGITDGPNSRNTLNRKYLMQAHRRLPEAPAARPRRPGLLPPPGPRDAHRGDGVGDARHDPAGQGPLLGHLRVERLRDHGRLADRRAPPPRQARRRAAAVQPLPQEARGDGVPPPLPRHRPGAHAPGARSPRACSPASTARACPRTAAAPSRACSSSSRISRTRRRTRRWASSSSWRRSSAARSPSSPSPGARGTRTSPRSSPAPRAWSRCSENLKAVDVVPKLTAPVLERIEKIVAGHGN